MKLKKVIKIELDESNQLVLTTKDKKKYRQEFYKNYEGMIVESEFKELEDGLHA